MTKRAWTLSLAVHALIAIGIVWSPFRTSRRIQVANPGSYRLTGEFSAREKSLAGRTKAHRRLESPSALASASSTESPPGSLASQQVPGASFDLYLRALIQQIDEKKLYPRDSLFREEEGRVVVTVQISPDGTIRATRITEPCPFERLNHAALETFKRISKLPPLPPGQTEQMQLEIPMIYLIKRG